ncbi:hypothetical protein F5Y15DRAFT_245342 [Xylariaceae sp. FL0016]|nr:hypothetical protein F5Y15DRAFT_245342 [Xylariaceae sp. FL0016]
MRALMLPSSLLFSLFLQTAPTLALENDFSAYPEGSQECLTSAADESQCTGNTGTELNECLCTNQGNFIYDSADCIAKASPGDLNAVYETMSNNCAGTGVTIAVSKDAFLAAAAAATSTTSSATPTATSTGTQTSSGTKTSTTTTPTSSSTQTASPDSGISTGAKIGIGVGIAFGAIALAIAGWFVFAYSRRKRSSRNSLNEAHNLEDNSHPGSPPSGYAGAAGTYRSEFAHENPHGEAAELAPVEWKPPYGEGKDAKSNIPLLAELNGGVGQTDQPAELEHREPAELPAEPYSDHSHAHQGLGTHGYGGERSVTPQDSRSPGGYTQSVSPFSSRFSTTGTGTGTGTY